MIQDRLNGYNCRSSLEEEQSLREITQEIVPAALESNLLARTAFSNCMTAISLG